jgi:hypothetical protein
VQSALFRLPATPASTELVATTRRQHRVVHYQLADPRVAAMLGLAQGLLDDHAAACCRIPEA